ncbi:hypothetical protein OT109_15020 [Phycisphaeraceae bacterium D3-23]
MTLSDELAREAMQNMLKAFRDLPDDASPAERMKLVVECYRLLDRTETKTTHVHRLGDG